MEKRILMFVYLMILTLFFGCENKDSSKITNRENNFSGISLDEAKEVMLKNDSIQQFLSKQKANNIKLLACEFIEDSNFYHFNFSYRQLPIYINFSYKIFPYEDFYILLGQSYPLKDNSINDSIIQKLIQDNLITFESKRLIQEDYNYFNFILCKNEIHKVGYFDYKMENDSVHLKKPFNLEEFYPHCNK